jgi:hypothetical protein
MLYYLMQTAREFFVWLFSPKHSLLDLIAAKRLLENLYLSKFAKYRLLIRNLLTPVNFGRKIEFYFETNIARVVKLDSIGAFISFLPVTGLV